MLNQISNKDIKLQLDKEIESIKSRNCLIEEYKARLTDLSHLKTYTIDDSHTREIDDAISLERINDKYKLWVHISSPPAHIEYNSLIDKNARKLISTLYLSTSNIYMFPEILIDLYFSLSKSKKRKCLSLGVIFNLDGSVSSSEIVQSLIKTNYQLSYDDADELIDYAPKEEDDLSIISRILEKRKCWRKKLGAKEILESYGKIIVNDKVPTLKLIDPTLSRLLVSEAMILYGDLLSNYTSNNNIPVPYRVQESRTGIINEKELNISNEVLYNFLLKKSMGKTYYSMSPKSHDSLGLKSYLHATSPIRRYSDLLVHYQINRYLNNKVLISKEEINYIINDINKLGRQNINKYREDQKLWTNKWFKNNQFSDYKVIFLNWINRYKHISIIYFVDFKFTSICYLRTKLEIKPGQEICIKNITNDYKDMLYFKLNS